MTWAARSAYSGKSTRETDNTADKQQKRIQKSRNVKKKSMHLKTNNNNKSTTVDSSTK